MENPDLISLCSEIHTGRSAMRDKIEAQFGNDIHDKKCCSRSGKHTELRGCGISGAPSPDGFSSLGADTDYVRKHVCKLVVDQAIAAERLAPA